MFSHKRSVLQYQGSDLDEYDDTEVNNIICVNDGQNVVCDNTVDNNQAIDKDGGI